MKILNLYAGIGGNRKLWGDEHEVTAVEFNPEIAKIYSDFFPKDKVVVGDAHKYLLEHYKEFNFIWASPPCPSHSKMRLINTGIGERKSPPAYPDMSLYQEIIFLKHFFKGKWVVENVIPYYEPLIKPQKIGRHYFWSNFILINKETENTLNIKNGYKRDIGFDISNVKLKKRKDQILNNCVEPKIGLHIFKCAFKEQQKTLSVSTGETDKKEDKKKTFIYKEKNRKKYLSNFLH